MTTLEEMRRERLFRFQLSRLPFSYGKEVTHGTPAACNVIKPSQGYFTNLLSALRPSANGKEFTHGTFAACNVIKPLQGFSLKTVRVKSAGKFELPLPTKSTSRLRNVCKTIRFGKVEPAFVERCWQVDGSKVSFPGKPTFVSETIRTLAMESVIALGLDGAGLQLEARLSKLLL